MSPHTDAGTSLFLLAGMWLPVFSLGLVVVAKYGKRSLLAYKLTLALVLAILLGMFIDIVWTDGLGITGAYEYFSVTWIYWLCVFLSAAIVWVRLRDSANTPLSRKQVALASQALVIVGILLLGLVLINLVGLTDSGLNAVVVLGWLAVALLIALVVRKVRVR